MTDMGWFADISDDESVKNCPWQPFLQAAGGCFPLPIWFETEEACRGFIRDHIAGKGVLDL